MKVKKPEPVLAAVEEEEPEFEPVAFIIMEKDGISLLPVSKGKWDSIIDVIPDIAKKISKLKSKLKTNDSDEESASADDSKE